jgi:hypothetical protein
MKCHAGVEFPSGEPCPECGAELGEACWPGINADLLEVKELRKQIVNLRGALAFIHNSTEEGAIKHRDYDHLAISVYSVAKEALDGKFVDDMHAAEVYDKLYPRASVTSGDRGGK